MKTDRRKKILELINTHEIETQEELAALLSADGFNITQATVSRDISVMGLKKTLSNSGKTVYTANEIREAPKTSVILKEGIISMEPSSNLLVIKTRPGHAPAVAAAVDSDKETGIIGTIAGDDTIFCALPDPVLVKAALTRLKKLMGGI